MNVAGGCELRRRARLPPSFLPTRPSTDVATEALHDAPTKVKVQDELAEVRSAWGYVDNDTSPPDKRTVDNNKAAIAELKGPVGC